MVQSEKKNTIINFSIGAMSKWLFLNNLQQMYDLGMSDFF